MDLDDLGFEVMHSLFKVGDDYLAELEQARAAAKLRVEAKRARGSKLASTKGKKPRSLKETQPW